MHEKSVEPPPLTFALWSIRQRMESVPNEMLSFITSQKITSVEVAGFFNMSAAELLLELKRRHLTVYSVHGPTLRPGKLARDFVEWAKQYTSLFETRVLGIEASPTFFPKEFQDYEEAYRPIAETINEIAADVGKEGIRVSYHCFPHDLRMVNGRPLVVRLFQGGAENLGLQLDTYWLHRAKCNLASVSMLPIDSVHLNERDSAGNACVLGTFPEKCTSFIHQLKELRRPLVWILENDSTYEDALGSGNAQLVVIKDCITQWPSLWASLDNKPKPLEDAGRERCESAKTGTRPSLGNRFVNVQEVFKPELRKATTEYLFGDSESLTVLPFDDDRIHYYVTQREARSADERSRSRLPATEERLFKLFWPPSQAPQIVQILGGAGSGKTTFLRYFFQYYLPHRESIVAGGENISPIAVAYAEDVSRHIVLYANLRRLSRQASLRLTLFQRLRRSFEITIQERALVNVMPVLDDDSQEAERWLWHRLNALARDTDESGRKWYISWVLDNADQLEEQEQRELLNIVHDFVPEEQTPSPASERVTEAGRVLWRVFIPIRPETRTNLSPSWAPLRNSVLLELPKVDFDDLINKRAQFLYRTVSQSHRHLTEDVVFEATRPHYNLITPTEMADTFSNVLLAACRLEGEPYTISPDARRIMDLLSHDSARRRITVLSRAAFSRSFRERYNVARLSRWKHPPMVTDFYLYDGLICGDSGRFEQGIEGLPILNVYNLGVEPGKARSVFVGVHALFLLSTGRQWTDVASILQRIGYDSIDIQTAEEWLRQKELIKKLWTGSFITELSVVKGHWFLVKERAYTDCMAVACAQVWGTPEAAPQTDPLNPSDLLRRFGGSLWMIKSVSEREEEVSQFQEKMRGVSQSYNEFATFFDNLKLPSITQYIAKEYLTKMTRMPDFERPKATIEARMGDWRQYIRELDEIASTASTVLTARR